MYLQVHFLSYVIVSIVECVDHLIVHNIAVFAGFCKQLSPNWKENVSQTFSQLLETDELLTSLVQFPPDPL